MALIAAHLNAGHSGDDSVAIGIYSPYPFPTFSPSLISLMVSVDVKHHVYNVSIRVQEMCESRGGRPGLSVLTSLMVFVDIKQY